MVLWSTSAVSFPILILWCPVFQHLYLKPVVFRGRQLWCVLKMLPANNFHMYISIHMSLAHTHRKSLHSCAGAEGWEKHPHFCSTAKVIQKPSHREVSSPGRGSKSTTGSRTHERKVELRWEGGKGIVPALLVLACGVQTVCWVRINLLHLLNFFWAEEAALGRSVLHTNHNLSGAPPGAAYHPLHCHKHHGSNKDFCPEPCYLVFVPIL